MTIGQWGKWACACAAWSQARGTSAMMPARERQSEFLPVEADLAQCFSGSQMPIKASQHQGNVLDKALEQPVPVLLGSP